MTASSAGAPAPSSRLSADFWKFWLGQTISNLGSSFTGFALPLIVFKLTGSATNLALSSAASLLPLLLFGLVIGAWVDRVNRRRLMIGADIAHALVLTSVPLLAAFSALSVGWIYAVLFVSSTLMLCFSFAQVTAVASLVTQDDLVTANGRIQASYSAATAAGPLLAGLLIAVVPIPTLLLFDALSFLLSATSLLLIRRSFNTAGGGAPPRLRHAIAEGLRYVVRHPVLGPLTAMAALVSFVGSTIGGQLVLFAKVRLHAADAQVGLLFSAHSVGVIVLSLAAGRLRKQFSFGQMVLGGMMLHGLFTLILAGVHDYWAAVPLVALRAGMIMLFNITVISLRQAIVPNQMLGRVTSTLNVLVNAAAPLGALIGGVAIERVHNVALAYGTAGMLMFLIPIAFWLTPLGQAERYLPPSGAGPKLEQAGAAP